MAQGITPVTREASDAACGCDEVPECPPGCPPCDEPCACDESVASAADHALAALLAVPGSTGFVLAPQGGVEGSGVILAPGGGSGVPRDR